MARACERFSSLVTSAIKACVVEGTADMPTEYNATKPRKACGAAAKGMRQSEHATSAAAGGMSRLRPNLSDTHAMGGVSAMLINDMSANK